MSESSRNLWGLMAVFETPEELIEAARLTRLDGYRKFDAYSPFPVEGLPEAMEFEHTGIPPICWIAGFIGAASGFAFMTWTTVIRFPLNSGGRPYFSWPAYVPITFELMVLFGGVFTFLGVLGLNRLPHYYHPVFNIDEFQKRNSSDGFFLVIEAEDPKFSVTLTQSFLDTLNPLRTYQVPHAP